MKNILSNIWTKRGLALVGALYAAGVCRLAYLSIFYDIHVKSRLSLCMMLVAVSLIALTSMLLSRKQVLTKMLVECEYIDTYKATKLNPVSITPELEDEIRAGNDLAALPAFNCFR